MQGIDAKFFLDASNTENSKAVRILVKTLAPLKSNAQINCLLATKSACHHIVGTAAGSKIIRYHFDSEHKW